MDIIPKVTPRRRREKKPTREIFAWHNVARRAEQEKVDLEINSAVEKKAADISVHHRRYMADHLLLVRQFGVSRGGRRHGNST